MCATKKKKKKRLIKQVIDDSRAYDLVEYT